MSFDFACAPAAAVVVVVVYSVSFQSKHAHFVVRKFNVVYMFTFGKYGLVQIYNTYYMI